MASIGAILVSPEATWKRYDDTDDNIYYFGAWTRQGNGSNYTAYNSTWLSTVTVGDSMEFSMVSTRLRIIAYGNNDTSCFEVKVDGISKGLFKSCYGITRPLLCCDISGLGSGLHHVQIILNDKSMAVGSTTTRLLFDCLDIDDTGYLMPMLGVPLVSPGYGWTRYDNTVAQLTYTGTWTKNNSNASYYNSSYAETSVSGDYVKFKIYGGKLRVIGTMYGNGIGSGQVDVLVDGSYVTSFTTVGPMTDVKIILGEVTLPSVGIHEIVLMNRTPGKYFTLDAIDLPTSATLLARVGISIPSAQVGWTRYEDNFAGIEYKGSGWFRNSGYDTITSIFGSTSIKFSFYGAFLRVLGYCWSNRSDQHIWIDGVDYGAYSNQLTSSTNTIIFEALNLSMGLHTVVITGVPGTGTYFGIDSIDVDAAGYIVNPPKTVKLNTTTFTFNNLYFVDPSLGSDSWLGTEGSPLATMGQAISRAAATGDAIFLKGESAEECVYGTKTISVFGEYLKFGSKLSGRQHGAGSSSMATVTYYGLSIYQGVTSGWSEEFYYINATLYNCVFYDVSPYVNVYGSYNFNNCLIISSLASPYSGTTFTNCGFVYSAQSTANHCLSYITYDGFYNITSGGWRNAGVGANLDGSTSDIGVYGGLYAWGNMYTYVPLNFQHYAIKIYDKYYILNKAHFDSVQNKFIPLTLAQISDLESTLDNYVLNIQDMFSSFVVNGKTIYPFDYISQSSSVQIIKIIGVSNTHPSMYYNVKYSSLRFYTNFKSIYKSTLIKLKDVIRLPFQEMKYFVTSNASSTIRIGIENNSIIYGKNFEIINEDSILTHGFTSADLNKFEIPFDNVRFIIDFTGNCGVNADELQLIKIVKNNNYLRKLLTDKDYALVVRDTNNSIYIKMLNDSVSSITVDKLEKENIEYRVSKTLDTF